MPRRSNREEADKPLEYRADRSFGDHLFWHLYEWGTRPGGSLSDRGKAWVRKEFAAAVDRDPHTVSNWRQNKNVPHDISIIEKALFGDDKCYDEWRIDLQCAAELLKTATNPGNIKLAKLNSHSYSNFLPAQTVPFIGRESTIKYLEKIIVHSTHSEDNLAVIHSLGGIGKTSLAIEFAHRYKSSFYGILWINANSHDEIVASFAKFGTILAGNSSLGVDQVKACDVAIEYLMNQSHAWLVIFDNVHNPVDLKRFLLPLPIRSLVTSRFSDWSEFRNSIEIEILSNDESYLLLQEVACRQDLLGARLLAKVLQRLPLALTQAAVYCRRTTLSFSDYAKYAKKLIKESVCGVTYPLAVYATFKIAIERINPGDRTYDLIWFLGHCGPENVCFELVEAAFDNRAEMASALLPLIEYSVVKICINPENDKTLHIHRIVQGVARLLCQEMGQTASVIPQVFGCISMLYPDTSENYFEKILICEKLTPHVIAITSRSFDDLRDIDKFPTLLAMCGTFLLDRGAYYTAEKILNIGRNICVERVVSCEFLDWTLSRRWWDLLDKKFHERFQNMMFETDYFAYQRFLLYVFDLRIYDMLIRLSKIGVFDRSSELDIMKEKILCFLIIYEGLTSLRTCHWMCSLALSYASRGKNAEAAAAYACSRSIFWSHHCIETSIGDDFSWEILQVLYDDEKDRMSALEKQIDYARHKDNNEQGEFLMKLASIRMSMGDLSSAFRAYKGAYHLFSHGDKFYYPSALSAYLHAGLLVTLLGKFKIGGQICDKALKNIIDLHGEHSMQAMYARKHIAEVQKNPEFVIPNAGVKLNQFLTPLDIEFNFGAEM